MMNWACVPIERGLSEAGIARILPDWKRRERHSALEHDFHRLKMAPPPISSCAIPSDVGSLLGWAYVLEGSRLGAQVILRTLEASGDVDVRAATHFLRHGAGEGFWASYIANLATLDGNDIAIARASAAAAAGFAAFLAAAGYYRCDTDGVVTGDLV